jgi:hypothetical protein
MNASESPFIALPKVPTNWDADSDLDFRLSAAEVTFLHARLSSLMFKDDRSRPALLATLVMLDAVPKVHCCWSPELLEIAGHDRGALERAGQAAALSAIGRGVYAALVEDLRECNDKRPTSRTHRSYLTEVLEEHANSAILLDLQALVNDIGPLPRYTMTVLIRTLEWLARGKDDPLSLLDCYRDAEHHRKKQRARLMPDFSGRERRFEWDNQTHTLAEPLHFRWPNIYRLLCDLNGQTQ